MGMIRNIEQFEEWRKRYLPIEDAIIAEREKRKRARLDNLREQARVFGDLCEATEGLAKVKDVDWLFRRAQSEGDTYSLGCLRKFVGTSAWSKLHQVKAWVRRPSYYEEENARRRALREERRKITRRKTLNPCPTREEILEAWTRVLESHEAMLRFGSMIMDLECFVDNS